MAAENSIPPRQAADCHTSRAHRRFQRRQTDCRRTQDTSSDVVATRCVSRTGSARTRRSAHDRGICWPRRRPIRCSRPTTPSSSTKPMNAPDIDFLLGYLAPAAASPARLKVVITRRRLMRSDLLTISPPARAGTGIMVSGECSGRAALPALRRVTRLRPTMRLPRRSMSFGAIRTARRHPDLFAREREIREAADHLRKHLAHQPLFRMPKYAPFCRLSQPNKTEFLTVTPAGASVATNVPKPR